MLFALEEVDANRCRLELGYVKSLDRLVSDSRCRIVIGESIDLDLPFKLTSGGGKGKFNLEMQGRLRLPISVANEAKMPVDWMPPQSPQEIGTWQIRHSSEC